jgi:hypothetical protein
MKEVIGVRPRGHIVQSQAPNGHISDPHRVDQSRRIAIGTHSKPPNGLGTRRYVRQLASIEDGNETLPVLASREDVLCQPFSFGPTPGSQSSISVPATTRFERCVPRETANTSYRILPSEDMKKQVPSEFGEDAHPSLCMVATNPLTGAFR